jgi:hypothetical protein
MDPSAGSRPPTPTGPRTRTGNKHTSAWLGTASPSTGMAPHCTAITRATSTSARLGAASPSTGTAPHQTAVSPATSVTRPNTKSSGSFEPLRDDNNDADLTSSPVLLSNPGGIGDVLLTGDATAPSGLVSAVGADTVGDTASLGTTAGDTPDVSKNDMALGGAISEALLSVTSKMEAVYLRMAAGLLALDLAIRSLHEEVRSNHGHVTKRLIKPLADRVAALKERTVRLEDGLTEKGSALLATVEEIHETAATIVAVVNHATNNFGSRLLALEASHRGTSSTAAASRAPTDPPESDDPLVDSPPSPKDATANSCVAWDCVHHQVTLPCVPPSARRQGPHLLQTTLPGAFQPRRSPGCVGEDNVTEASGRADISSTPGQVDPALPTVFPNPEDNSDIVRGLIISPQHWDKESQAWSLGASRFDATRLACCAYHVGDDGVPTLTEEIIRNCGFTRIKASADDVVVCYNDIMYVHKKVQELWYNSSFHTLGPQVDRILQKSLSVFPRLASTDTGDVVTFYNRLQEVSMNQPAVLPPSEPPPPPCQTDFPPGSLAHNLLRPHTRKIASVHWQGDSVCSDQPTLVDSITHIIGSPHVYGITGTDATLVKIAPSGNSCPLIDGGSNICVTGDLQLLIDSVDIPPMAISVALDGPPSSFDDTITERGLLQFTLLDGTTYHQPCYYCANMAETIISPAAVLASSDQLYFWTQVGCKDPTKPGSLQCTSRDGRFSLTFDLEYHEGLYYCTSDVYTSDTDPMRGQCHCTVAPNVPGVHCTPPKFLPTSKACQVESEVWMLRFGAPGEYQLNVLPQHIVGTPLVFEYHPFRYIDFKEQAYIRKQAAQRKAERIPTCGAEFYMDFGFMWSSTEDYKCPNKSTDQVVTSYDGYSSHLIIVDGASGRVWIFLTSS